VIAPSEVQVIGRDLAIRWQDGHESYIGVARLRAASPSAEVQGEQDIFGQVRGGGAGPGPADVEIVSWKQVGNYALQFQFSDGHQTGIYTYDYLRRLGDGEEPA
jgi:DUF971 family protein